MPPSPLPAGGPDVYAGIPRDYTGGNVTAKTLLAVLAGDKAAVKGKGSGRVLEAGPHDRVFLFYSDHGSAGGAGRAARCSMLSEGPSGTTALS